MLNIAILQHYFFVKDAQNSYLTDMDRHNIHVLVKQSNES